MTTLARHHRAGLHQRARPLRSAGPAPAAAWAGGQISDFYMHFFELSREEMTQKRPFYHPLPGVVGCHINLQRFHA